MAKDFTTKEAKQVIQEHEYLLKTLRELSQLSLTAQQLVHNSENRLTDQLESMVSYEVQTDTNECIFSADVAQFISSLFYYQKVLPIESKARYYQEYQMSQIQTSLELLSPGANSIQWLFTKATAKKQANEAYLFLRELLSDSYSQSIYSMKEEASALRNVPYSIVLDDFLTHRTDYRICYHRLSNNKNEFRKQIQIISELIEQQQTLDKQIVSCNTSIKVEEEQIKIDAMQLASLESLAILADVPVEELNRERSGIRVKTLREHGYSTIADVYAASVYQIESIHGISEDSAYMIKRMAYDIAEQAKKTAKIRLSVDNRTKEATKLIVSIYGYRYRNKKREEFQNYISSHKNDPTPSIKILQQIDNITDWLFYAELRKDTIREAYTNLKCLLSSEYTRTVRQYITDLSLSTHHDNETAWKDFADNSIAYFNILENIIPGILGNDDSLYGLPEELAREIQEESFFPDGLLCELRRYQEWGVKYALHQERVLLGDEMGLGKTVQAIATMVSLRNTGATHFMVVCPASVLANWCREIRKMSRLSVTKIHGYDRYTATQSWIKTGGVAVTTYETTGHIRLENNFKFSLMVVDEAHYIKNPDAQRTMNVKKISDHTERLLFMTGTALENKVDEMISLIKMLQPKIAASVRGMEFLSSAPQFRKKVAPVYYRRKREDVLTELPELIESREWCVMTSAEEGIYEDAILSKRYSDARRVSWNVENIRESSKARRMMELIAEAKADGRKIIVFSYFLDTIRKVSSVIGNQCFGPINGSVSPQKRQDIIDQFDKAPPGAVLAAQIQAGGTGLNIQSASVVIICEPQFKPSIENQAISRAYRMGQTRNVLVYRLLCEDTVDEKITSILENKQAIFDAFADKSEAATQSMELDDKTFGNIIKEEIDRINAKRAQMF